MSRQPARNLRLTALVLLALACIPAIGHAAPKIRTPASSPATLTQGNMSAAYTFTFAGTGGDTWGIASGTLPPGLSLNAQSGNLSGTPTSHGTYTFTIQFSRRGGAPDTCVCTLVIAGCSFSAGSSGAIDFGGIDPSSGATAYGSVTQQLSVTCTPAGKAYSVAVTPASGWAMSSGANAIPYTLGTAPSGSYAGSPVNLLLAPPSTSASAIAPGNFQNAAAGSYANASAITISLGYGTGSLTATLSAGSVRATVIPMCTVFQNPGTLTFTLDPSIAGTSTAAISPGLSIKCTRNASFSVSAASTCGGLSQTYPPTCGGYLIPYTFGFSPGFTSGQGFGVAIPMNISGSASSTNYQNAPAGSYGDRQTLTISY